MLILHRRKQFVAHAVGRAQAEFPGCLVDHVNRTRLSTGELRRLGDDGVEHSFEINRRIDRLADLAERP